MTTAGKLDIFEKFWQSRQTSVCLQPENSHNRLMCITLLTM